jgi:hypothetical protein
MNKHVEIHGRKCLLSFLLTTLNTKSEFVVFIVYLHCYDISSYLVCKRNKENKCLEFVRLLGQCKATIRLELKLGRRNLRDKDKDVCIIAKSMHSLSLVY